MPDGQKHGEAVPTLRSPAGEGWGVIETLAAVATALWILAALAVWLLLWLFGGSADTLGPLLVVIAVLMPVGLIWTAARAIRAERTARDETRRLHQAVTALRQNMLAERQSRLQSGLQVQSAGPGQAGAGPSGPSRGAGVSAAAQPQRAEPGASRPGAIAEDEPRLSLGGEPDQDGPPLSHADFIRALHFPDDAADAEGFAALHRALSDRPTRQLIQASQDVLTLLSQDGIYMDDLAIGRAHPDIWRRFARGERGGAITTLGDAQDAAALAAAAARLREDAIFRDAAHHFLRLFDRRLTAFEPDAGDDELVLLSETRTARAFMLLGQVAGIFD